MSPRMSTASVSIPHGAIPPQTGITEHLAVQECLSELSCEDPACILVTRRITVFGFESEEFLCQHYSNFGIVTRVLIAHVRIGSGAESRMRPGAIGFVVMDSAESAARILALGETHVVYGHPINVQQFCQFSVCDSFDGLSVEPTSADLSSVFTESMPSCKWWHHTTTSAAIGYPPASGPRVPPAARDTKHKRDAGASMARQSMQHGRGQRQADQVNNLAARADSQFTTIAAHPRLTSARLQGLQDSLALGHESARPSAYDIPMNLPFTSFCRDGDSSPILLKHSTEIEGLLPRRHLRRAGARTHELHQAQPQQRLNENDSEPRNSLRNCLKYMEAEDPDTILVVNGAGRLGSRAWEVLAQHFAHQGTVVTAMVPLGKTSKSSARPGNRGFLQMSSPQEVLQILALGKQQEVQGHIIKLERFVLGGGSSRRGASPKTVTNESTTANQLSDPSSDRLGSNGNGSDPWYDQVSDLSSNRQGSDGNALAMIRRWQ